MAPDTLTFIGLETLDSTSGAGNDIRFDFASLGILNDGGVVVAYHDSSDPDPLFAVELQNATIWPSCCLIHLLKQGDIGLVQVRYFLTR